MNSFLQKECDLQFFHNNGFIRKQCASCGSHFWTLDSNAQFCGDKPCVDFSFINNPLTKKPFSITEVRESFLSFFEQKNHSRLCYPETGERCPVVARWRSDIYLTIASIADFQPHITSGVVPPPANPLVISQPCIRLNDLEKIGVSGRHLSMFEMMGHHAFNKNVDEIYWKEETVKYCDEFFVKNIGIPREAITYKEQLWDGGGNAGPCLEVLAGGLEIATLVFMNMKEDENGKFIIKSKKYSSNPLNIVDTGYGLERIAWCSQGTKTIYETVFPETISWLQDHAKDTSDIISIYSLADHSKCLAFMLGDGIVPSNVKAGYLARLIIRRSLRFIKKLGLSISLRELVDIQLDRLEQNFPSLKNRKKQVDEILDIETKRFSDTVSKGKNLIERILKDRQNIDKNSLINLYDTHGMPPEVVQRIAKDNGVNVIIPDNFDSMIAELHSHEKKEEAKEETQLALPDTKRLYYKDHYTKEFEAKVLWVKGSEVILDQTAFYPDGGGQPGDIGSLTHNGKKIVVKETKKVGNAIIHVIDGNVDVGDEIHGQIDWGHRYTLMKHHTSTHLVNGALRQTLGKHIWQAGSQLGISEVRFDFSHYKCISEKEKETVEDLANQFIKQEVTVEKKVMDRNSAEKMHGFRLYQGGVPPGNTIRVINIPGIDVEACGGMHLNNTREVEKIRILKTERIQDGVNRIVFAAGKMADRFQKEENKLYTQIVKTLSSTYGIKEQKNVSEQLKEVSKIFSVPSDQLDKTIKRFLNETKIKQRKTTVDLRNACNDLFDEWKKTQKMKKLISSDEIKQLKNKAEAISGTEIKVITATSTSESTATAGAITKEPNYVVHIYDGDKITSAASENVNIDLREIALEIGKILGGSGGGKPKLTQSGGPNKEKLLEAMKKAKNLTKKQLEKTD
ncbi:alanyl-tRNA synthetase [Thermoplasmatales archaeon SCGC AB-539-N05]|nr:alanyl-tRNA synthetase [Thermoplasmatales archaeon SCGC AB-539-N05]